LADQLILPLEAPPALGRGDFIVGPANREAIGFIDSFPNWPAPAAALYGPSGSGKSHLVAIWARLSAAHVVEAQALDQALLNTLEGPVAVENVGALTASREAALFALLERGGPVLLTSHEPPSTWPVNLPDLASRCRALLAFALWAPDDALLAGLAAKLFADRQLNVPDAVVEHMIRLLERSPGAIRDFVARADAKALAEKRPVTLPLIRELLAQGGVDDP
jgi:chromosomal replication initiation ATPase DnaA